VLTSPLRRARDTCRIAGYGAEACVEPDLCEWDYGAYEGRTSAEIREQHPDWSLFEDGVEGGETLEQVAARVDRALVRARQDLSAGDVALFAHGHFLRILAARWLALEPSRGRSLVLDTAALCVLGHEHDAPAIIHWNDVSHLAGT
jgi:probable phosphoglycerate mutase